MNAPCSSRIVANVPTAVLPLTANRLATVGTYMEMRNDLWKELSGLASLQMSPYSIGLLELCNRVVKTLLEAGPESIFRSLEILKCGICETWIDRVRYELKVLNGADRNGQSHVDLNFVRDSLKLALSQEKPLPAPAPSFFEPPGLNHQ